MAKKGFLTRLREDKTGNTIVIAAASLIPMIGMVGGAVDASRYYMTVTRLQNACDAGALAARRAMENDTFTEEHRDLGYDFFDENYKDGQFGLDNLSRSYTADNDGKVTGVASGDLPTTLMKVFNYEDFDVSVTCSAEINISNTDIMFVLDVTGSMNCPDDGSSCPGGNNGNTEVSNSRIVGLRSAVMNFYDTVEAATSASAQVRYGIVPYASNVNVGRSIPVAFMKDTNTYQSRVAETQEVTYWDEEAVNIIDIDNADREGSRISRIREPWINNIETSQECDALAPPDNPFEYIDGTLNEDGGGSTVDNGDGTRTRTVTGEADFFRDDINMQFQARNDRCRVRIDRWRYEADVELEITERERIEDEFWRYVYRPVEFDVSGFYTGTGQVITPTGNQGADQTHTWDGCIEEADTVSDATFSPIPVGANDLNINATPSSDAERWKPTMPNVAYRRIDSGTWTTSWLYQDWDESRPGYSCPAEAFRLRDIPRADLQTYVNNLRGRSNTYHDIGMIWGARFITPNGMFSADNATAPNGDAIARHIVFMTDGILATNVGIYGTYGTEWWDRRVTDNGGNNEASPRHAARFQAACRAARQENISVWVVAFGTTLSQNLIDCATPGRAYAATNAASLNTAFQEIAQKIAALRLTS